MTLALGASVCSSLAQDADNRPPRGERPPQGEGRPDSPDGGPRRGPGGPGGDSQRQRPPLIAALDANNDGVIDEAEMANATAALKKLDKNGDGKLTMDELMPPRQQGGPRGPGGPDGAGVGGPEGRRPGGPEGRAPGGPDGERRERPQRPPADQ